jgi:DNA-binding Lrp family transcriptional regulator
MTIKDNKRGMILSLLKEQGILSTTAIAEGTRSNIHITKDRLNKLQEEGVIEEIQTPRYLYWKLK